MSLFSLGIAAACSMDATADLPSGAYSPTAGSGGSFNGGGVGKGGTGGTPADPEVELEDSYTAPVVSGRFIWTANPLSGRVALIDAENLTVATAEAGLGPTFLTALGGSSATESAAVVLNVQSRDASILRAKDGVISVETAPVHDGANRLSVSPSGRWVLVWSDAKLVAAADPTEGMQDVTVLDLSGAAIKSRRLTVGYRPDRVVIREDERAAFVVAEPGVSVIALSDDRLPEVVRDVPVTHDPTESASARDVTVTSDGEFAFVRREGSPVVEIVALDDGRTRTVTLPSPVTDLDLSPDGELAFAVARATSAGETPSTGGTGAGGSSGSSGSGGSGGTDLGPWAAGGTSATGGSSGASASGGSSAAGAGGFGGELGGDAGSGDLETGGVPNEAAAGQGGEPAVDGAGGVPGGAGGEAGADAAGGNGTAGDDGAAGGDAGPSPVSESYVAVLPVKDIFEHPDRFTLLSISEVVGSVAVAPTGDVAVLFTTVGGNDRLTILETQGLGSGGKPRVEPRTVVVKAPVRAVLPTADGEHAVVLLDRAQGSLKPGGFSLVPLKASLPPKIVGTDAPPLSVGIGSHEALITISGKNEDQSLRGVYLARFPELSTKLVSLASPPLSAALVPPAGVGFVAQSHPEGRITFLDLETGAPRTLTGFELSARVIQ